MARAFTSATLILPVCRAGVSHGLRDEERIAADAPGFGRARTAWLHVISADVPTCGGGT